ncbi:hypothetical protein [Thiolapillus sp.]
MVKIRHILLFLILGSATWAAMAAAAPGERELLRYTQGHDMIASGDFPLLQVFDSGRVRVHLPAWMKNSGDYEYFLTDREFKVLKDRLGSRSVQDFDRAAVEKELRAAEAAAVAGGRQLFEISDNTYTRMVLNPGSSGQEKNISWTNLQNDAQRHAGLRELGELAETERLLQKLLHHPQMKPLD